MAFKASVIPDELGVPSLPGNLGLGIRQATLGQSEQKCALLEWHQKQQLDGPQ
jgi:hypothetical protein